MAEGTEGRKMVEFQEVMKQWLRMCKAYPKCEGCKLNAYDEFGYKYNCHENGILCNIDRVESVIMAWAKEHPESVYPSVAKYIEQFGIIIRRDGTLEADFFKANEPMSADIAQKLGIEPKEG